jgi:hypothetical protein
MVTRERKQIRKGRKENRSRTRIKKEEEVAERQKKRMRK